MMFRFIVVLLCISLHTVEIYGEDVLYIIQESLSSTEASLADKYGIRNSRQLFGDDIPTNRPLSGNYYADYEGYPNQGARNKGMKLIYSPTFHNKATFTNDHNFVYTGGDAGRIYEYPTTFIPYERPTPKSLGNIFFAHPTKDFHPTQHNLQALESKQITVKLPAPKEIGEDVKMLLDFVSDPIYPKSGQPTEEPSTTPLRRFMRGMLSRLSTHLRNLNRDSQGSPGSSSSQTPQRRNGQNPNGNKPTNRIVPIGYKLLAPYEQPSGPNQPQQTRS
ncbi:unnamed protein product [Allacma fusca]|uniref:Uncharacterized protein n=1 Tax=Allacma fusca TaxID=39272 RepID=A0A8J2K6M2_9HEXA|nr:unnamed protein product [Allacma fusca]